MATSRRPSNVQCPRWGNMIQGGKFANHVENYPFPAIHPRSKIFQKQRSGQQAPCKWGLNRCRNSVLEKVRNMISWQEKYCSRAFPAKESDRCRSRTGGGDRPLPPSLPPSVPRHETLFGAGQQNLQLDGASICFKKRKMHLPSFILIFQQQLTCKSVFNFQN